ncbi:MAG TPA: iron ABC transporter permease [Acetobacteraceae bacterium]|nr:iron ABC transporter permease [Acetobacteraceae bacterium]
MALPAARAMVPRTPVIATESVVTMALVVVVSLLVFVPLTMVVLGAARQAGGFSLRPLLTALGSTRIMANTLIMGVGATVLSVTAGVSLALILVRIRTPGRAVLARLMTVPLYITPLLTAIAWSWLGSPRGGLINLFARQVLGIDSLINLHTPSGVIFVAALSYVPLPFLLVGAALRGMDPSLEESARVHGASTFASLRLVTLPLMLPAILGSALLVLVQAVGLFSVPAVLGLPNGFVVAGTQIYRLLNNYPPRVSEAAAWGLLLLVVTAGLVAVQTMLLRRRSYVTVSGKAFRPRLLDVGAARWLLAAVAWVYAVLAVVLPVGTLGWAALVNFITIDPHLMAFDFRHFHYVLFEYPKTYLALKNSLVLGAASATCVCALGLAVSWVIVRTRSPVRSWLDQISMVPLAMPSMVLALGLLWAYVGLKALPIYGTLWILLIAYVTHYLPFGVRAGTGALRQLHVELEDAARLSGASWGKAMRWIVLPLTRPTLIATWTLLFILAMQEVSSSILLYTSRTTVLAVAVFDLWEAGNVNALAALSVIQLAITFIALLLLFRVREPEVIA